MRVIRIGMSGSDVEAWKLFLREHGHPELTPGDEYDTRSVEATRAWQRAQGLPDDGVLGPASFDRAAALGFHGSVPLVIDQSEGHLSDEPARPPFEPLSGEQRKALFGAFAYRATPTPENPEALQILGDWAQKHIVHIEIPQLAGLPGAPASGLVSVHRLAAEPFRRFFQSIEDAGLHDRLRTYGGSWAPRFMRGSTSSLSNHAYGTAIDINAAWNALGAVPARHGEPGCVRELVALAHAQGLFWGGHFRRLDGMHFELARITTLS